MKKQIRKGVFETNSSSTHSISVAENSTEVMDNILPDENGVVKLYGNEFGWEYDSYRDAQSKASYAMIYALDWSGDKKEEFCQILKDVIKQQTGAQEVEFVSSGSEWYPYGYIDHQSVEDNNLHYMFETPEILRQFIFNPQSELVTDNDNH